VVEVSSSSELEAVLTGASSGVTSLPSQARYSAGGPSGLPISRHGESAGGHTPQRRRIDSLSEAVVETLGLVICPGRFVEPIELPIRALRLRRQFSEA
jgi:hypothetical protein